MKYFIGLQQPVWTESVHQVWDSDQKCEAGNNLGGQNSLGCDTRGHRKWKNIDEVKTINFITAMCEIFYDIPRAKLCRIMWKFAFRKVLHQKSLQKSASKSAKLCKNLHNFKNKCTKMHYFAKLCLRNKAFVHIVKVKVGEKC